MAIGYKQQTGATVTVPPAGSQYTFIDSVDGRLKRKDSAGVIVDIESADAGITELTGEVLVGPGTGTQPATISNAAVIAKVLTGLVESYGVVAATDTILQAISKLAWSQNLHSQDINQNLTIPSNYNLIRGMTRVKGTSVLKIESGAILKLI